MTCGERSVCRRQRQSSVVVFDRTRAPRSEVGRFRRNAPAAGAGPYDPNASPSRQFRDVTCVKIAKDGMVYVCDMSNRIQVFQKNGTFVKEMIIAKETRGAVTTIGQAPARAQLAGSVWDVAFSSEPRSGNSSSPTATTTKSGSCPRHARRGRAIGDGGRQPGRFLAVGSVAGRRAGNFYTGEQHHAKRVQKFAASGR